MLTAQLCRQAIIAKKCHGAVAARQFEIARVQGLERALRADSCPTLIKFRKLLALILLYKLKETAASLHSFPSPLSWLHLLLVLKCFLLAVIRPSGDTPPGGLPPSLSPSQAQPSALIDCQLSALAFQPESLQHSLYTLPWAGLLEDSAKAVYRCSLSRRIAGWQSLEGGAKVCG